MGISTEKVMGKFASVDTEKILQDKAKISEHDESVFSQNKDKTSAGVVAISIAGGLILGVAGIRFLPQLTKYLKHGSKNAIAKSAKTSTGVASMKTATNTHIDSEIARVKGLSAIEKEAEIKRLQNLIKEEESKFFQQNQDKFVELDVNNPLSVEAYKKRFREVFPDMRGAYGRSSLHLDCMAGLTASRKESYLSHLFYKSPRAKELGFQLKLAEMPPEELEQLSKAIKVLRAKKIPFNPNELVSGYGKDLMKTVVSMHGKFAQGSYVVGSDFAYRVNGLLRRGVKVDDIVMGILDQGFKEVKPFYRRTVYRSVIGAPEDGSIDFINRLLRIKKGDSFVDRGYSFSSYKRGAAQACNGIQDINSPNVIITIDIPKGAKVSDNYFSRQCEVLFPRNSVFKVVEEAHQTHPGVKFVSSDGIPMESGGTVEMRVKFIGTTDERNSSLLGKIGKFFSKKQDVVESNNIRYNYGI